MKEIKQYTIESSEDINALISRVNDMIEGGWQPFGDMVIKSHMSNGSTCVNRHCQPMVKYEKEKN